MEMGPIRMGDPPLKLDLPDGGQVRIGVNEGRLRVAVASAPVDGVTRTIEAFFEPDVSRAHARAIRDRLDAFLAES
jgi:hypothetical protein